MARPVPEKKDKTWTFLVYLAGDNDLSLEMVWSLQEMKRAASREDVSRSLQLLAMFDPKNARPRRYDLVTPNRHPLTDADGELRTFTSAETLYGEADLKEILRELRPGAKEPLSRNERIEALVEHFFREGLDALPRTERCAIVLSGHGGEAVGDFLTDSDPPSALGVVGLGTVLAKLQRSLGRKIDLLGIDSCQMSSAEAGYEARDSVHCLVASEGLVMNAGWPYHRVLEAASEAADAPSLSRAIAERYLDFYRDYEVAGVSTDIAVTDLGAIAAVAEQVRILGSSLTEPLSRLAPDGLEEAVELGELDRARPTKDVGNARSLRDAIVLAHWSAQSYKRDRYVDLYDFCQQLIRFAAAARVDEGILEGCRGVQEAIEKAVLRSGTTGPDFQHSHGLSIYFPWSSSDYFPEYRATSFAKDTGWADFVEVYLRSTTRVRRFQPEYLERVKEPDALVRDRAGVPSVAAAPRQRPPFSLQSGATKDVEAGTRRDVEAGTRRGEMCRSTTRNPPEGHYAPPARREK